MSLRFKLLRLARREPQLRTPLWRMIRKGYSSPKLLVPLLERLFPGEGKRVLDNFDMDEVWMAFQHDLDVKKVSTISEGMGGEEVQTSAGTHWDPPEYQDLDYTYPDEVGVYAVGTVPAKHVGRLLMSWGRRKPDAKAVVSLIRDPTFTKVFAKLIQEEFTARLSDEWWQDSSAGDWIVDAAKDEVEKHIAVDVFLEASGSIGTSKVVPDGKGGYKVTLNARVVMEATSQLADDY